eukprot:gnl/MRDRNA2_/MRDRNA2_77278_c1_seq1.p1 gnl/MRDRNA2_/MRDRNA2_77278_c1~~gnl/MRDRNA2_/MRDRNA2_77278_c1_seq1.p1  ORF type:complete len:227 (+),score=37.54 gnl/MRDRNA2_/MRDRNA2_77278_c1_seq1:94-774(+)
MLRAVIVLMLSLLSAAASPSQEDGINFAVPNTDLTSAIEAGKTANVESSSRQGHGSKAKGQGAHALEVNPRAIMTELQPSLMRRKFEAQHDEQQLQAKTWVNQTDHSKVNQADHSKVNQVAHDTLQSSDMILLNIKASIVDLFHKEEPKCSACTCDKTGPIEKQRTDVKNGCGHALSKPGSCSSRCGEDGPCCCIPGYKDCDGAYPGGTPFSMVMITLLLAAVHIS